MREIRFKSQAQASSRRSLAGAAPTALEERSFQDEDSKKLSKTRVPSAALKAKTASRICDSEGAALAPLNALSPNAHSPLGAAFHEAQ